MTDLNTRAANVNWSDSTQAASYLTELIPDLVCRVRDDDPDLTAAWIARRVPAEQWPAFAIILAAHVPTDRSQAELIAWALPPDDPTPWRPGHREFVRLRAQGVPLEAIAPEVRAAERRYHAAKYVVAKQKRPSGALAVPAALAPRAKW